MHADDEPDEEPEDEPDDDEPDEEPEDEPDDDEPDELPEPEADPELDPPASPEFPGELLPLHATTARQAAPAMRRGRAKWFMCR